MSTVLVPATLDELAEAVRSIPRLLPVGAGTKPRLSHVDPGVTKSTVGLRGIRYDRASSQRLRRTPLRA
jgi:hypothetical protein